MRSVIIVLVAALAMGHARIAPVSTQQNPLTARIMEEEVREFVGCVQDILRSGLPEHNLPSFDPLDAEAILLDLNSLEIPELAGLLNLANVHLAGAVNWEITNLKISVTIIPIGAKIDITLTWGAVSGHTDYTGDITVGTTNLFGSGNGDFEATEFSIEAHTKVKISPKLEILELSIRPHIDTFRTTITGLFNDEELSEQWSQAMTEGAAAWLNEHAQIIDERLSAAIMNAINNAVPGEPGEPGEENIITIIMEMCKAPALRK